MGVRQQLIEESLDKVPFCWIWAQAKIMSELPREVWWSPLLVNKVAVVALADFLGVISCPKEANS